MTQKEVLSVHLITIYDLLLQMEENGEWRFSDKAQPDIPLLSG